MDKTKKNTYHIGKSGFLSSGMFSSLFFGTGNDDLPIFETTDITRTALPSGSMSMLRPEPGSFFSATLELKVFCLQMPFVLDC